MQWTTVSGWNLIFMGLSIALVIWVIRKMIFEDCIQGTRKLHTEAVANVAREEERMRYLETWLERIERIVFDIRERVRGLEEREPGGHAQVELRFKMPPPEDDHGKT